MQSLGLISVANQISSVQLAALLFKIVAKSQKKETLEYILTVIIDIMQV